MIQKIKVTLTKSIGIAVQILDLVIPKNGRLMVFGAPKYASDPKLLFEYIRQENSTEINAIWLSRNSAEISEIHTKFGLASAYHLLSPTGIKVFLRAKYAIFSHGAADFFYYIGKMKSRKVKVNTWHGFPIKDASTLTYYSKTNWNVTLCSSTLEKEIYQKLAKLKGDIVISGLPRNEYLFKNRKNNELISSVKNELCMNVDFTPDFIITYAPTYRHHGKTELFPFSDFDLEDLLDFCKKNKLLFLLRFHPNEIETLESDTVIRLLKTGYFVKAGSSDFEMQDILLVSDFLITDYSSSFFDFLTLQRQTIFIPYDLEFYEKEYGFSINYQDVSKNSTCLTYSEFKDMLTALMRDPDYLQDQRRIDHSRFHEYDPENVNETIIKHLLS